MGKSGSGDSRQKSVLYGVVMIGPLGNHKTLYLLYYDHTNHYQF